MSPRTSAATTIRQHSGVIAVLAAVALGIGMRVAGWTWGFPADLHPDEWVIVEGALDLVHRKSFEPSMYYRPDHLEIQLSYLAYTVYSHLFLQMPVEGGYAQHPEHFLLISRAITTMFGIAMIVLAYLIGKRFHPHIGMIAAVLFALFPPFVENSQYATPDVPLTAALMLVILACMHYLEKPRYQSLLVACAAISAGIAIKYPALLGTFAIAVVVVWVAIRDRTWWRIPRDGVLAIVAVIGFLFVISPVLFTNGRHVISSFQDENQGTPIGFHGLGFAGNAEFYARAYLLYGGFIGVALAAVGLVVVIRKRLTQAVPLVLPIFFWLAMSAVSLHWPRWALPMYVTPLLLVSIGSYYGFLWLRARGFLGRWLVPLVAAVAVVSLGNMIVNAAPFATRPIAQETRLSMVPELERLGVTTENSIYEGYTPLLPNAPKEIFTELKDVDGRLEPVDPAKKYVVQSSCMMSRYMTDPRDADKRAFYRELADQAPLVTKARGLPGWTHSSFELLNIARSPSTIWHYVKGDGLTGCDIDVRRLEPAGLP
jgi:MFS family permease